ncbi:MAG: U32 family peptidase C-terminal domain-containing protein [Microgenomates group bacterium]
MADVLVGKITHYYDKIEVAVVEVLAPLKVGDQIKISGHGKEFTQQVTSMQIEHQQIQEAQKGQAIGMKVDQPVKEGDEIYKTE